VVIAVLLVVVGPAGPTTTNSISTWHNTTFTRKQTVMPAAGFEPVIPASAWPLAYALYVTEHSPGSVTGFLSILLFMDPCIVIYLIYENNQQDATIWVNLLFQISSTYFGRCFRPSSWALDSIYSMWCCSFKLLPAGVLDELKTHFIHDTSRQQLGWTLPNTVNTYKCSWWWAKTSPETCRADLE
jgi:hypothetical protein